MPSAVRGGWDYLPSSMTEAGGAMRVQRVVMPDSGLESWTVLSDEGVPLEPVERFLAYLASIERSPNTIKAYAHDLKDWFGFLTVQRLDWQAVTVEDVGGFVGWLRATGRPGWAGAGTADRRGALRWREREPQARGADLVL
jgi:hypothetical protein